MADLALVFDILARDRASSTFKGVGDSAETSGRKVESFGSRFGGMAKAAAAAAGVAAAAGALAFGKASIEGYKESEVAQTALSDAFAKFPQLAGANAEALRALNTERGKTTKFDDDATAAAQATLAQFGLTEDQMLRLTPLLQDYAEKSGKDLTTAATDVGKAMLGQGRAFKSVGLDLKDTGSAAGNFEQLVGGLTDKVGGFAEVAGGTATGKTAILGNQIGELQEKVGAVLVPALAGLTDILLTHVLPTIDRMGTWLAENKPVVVAFAAVIATGLVIAFVSWASAAAAAAVATIAATWPILAIIAVIALLVAGVIWAYQNWDFFRNAVDAVASFMMNTLWPALQSVAGWITDTLIPTIGDVIGKLVEWGGKAAEVAGQIVTWFSGVISFFTDLPTKIGDAVSGMWDGLQSSAKSAFNAVAGFWNDTVGGLKFTIPNWVPGGLGGKSWEVPDIPTLHSGGIFDSGRGEGLALLEDGEGVFTADQMRAMGRGGGVTIINHGVMSGERDIKRWVADAVRERDRAVS